MKRPQKKKKGGRPTSKGAMQAQRHAQYQQKYGTPERNEPPIFDREGFADRARQEVVRAFMPERYESYETSDLFARCPVLQTQVKESYGLVSHKLVHPVVLVDHMSALYIGLLRNILQHRSYPTKVTDLKADCDFCNITLYDVQEPWKRQYDTCIALTIMGATAAFIKGDTILPISLSKQELQGGGYHGYLRALQQDFDLKSEIDWLLTPEHRSARNIAALMAFSLTNQLLKYFNNDEFINALRLMFKALINAEHNKTEILMQIAAPDFDAKTTEIKDNTVHLIVH